MSSTTKIPITEAVMSDVSHSGVHSEKVLEWRQKEFRRLGFVDYVADFLASTQIDLTRMEKLLKKGCEHELAIQILAGTTWHPDVDDPRWRWTGEEGFELTEEEPENDDRDEAVAVA